MIMKAEVVEKVGSKFRVRIPTINGTALGSTSTPNHLLPLATLCTLPGIDNVLSPGDIVFVTFEENDYGKPVILGQLYTEKSAANSCLDIKSRTISIEDSRRPDLDVGYAKLPNNTTIGDVPFGDLQNMLFWFRNMNNH